VVVAEEAAVVAEVAAMLVASLVAEVTEGLNPCLSKILRTNL